MEVAVADAMEPQVAETEIEIDGEVEMNVEETHYQESTAAIVPEVEFSIAEPDRCCRVCLNPAPPNSLFEQGRDLKLALCIQMPVRIGDTLPSGICEKCSRNLDLCHSFKEMAERNCALHMYRQITLLNAKRSDRPKKNRNAIDVSNIQNLKDLNSLLFEPAQKTMPDFSLAEKIQETISSADNTRITLCDTTIKKASDALFDYAVEFDDEDEYAMIPGEILDEDLPPASIKVHKFDKYVKRLMLQENKDVKIISENDDDEAEAQESQEPDETGYVDNVEFIITNSENEVEEYVQNEEDDDAPSNYYTTTTEEIIPITNMVHQKITRANFGDSSSNPIIVVNKGGIEKHMNVSMTKEKRVCPSCGLLVSNLASHISTHHPGEKPFNCEICGRSYNSKSHYEVHMKRHTGNKDNVCEVCGAAYLFARSLIRHKLVHSGEKPYSCELCPMRFYVKCDLTRHLKIHAGIKPFKCSFCQLAFNAKHQLHNHMRMHTGEKPYSCEVCNVSFTYKVNLNNHCLRAHNVNFKFKPVYTVTERLLQDVQESLQHNEYDGSQKKRRPAYPLMTKTKY